MKCCPKCQANIEGLVYRCDCCGASIRNEEKRLFTCCVYELPQCLGFSSLTREMIDALQPTNLIDCSAVQQIGISMICYPNWILEDGNIKKRVYYSHKKQYVGLTTVVNFDDFIGAVANSDQRAKEKLIAHSLLQGIYMVQTRLRKNKLSIDDVVSHVESVLNKYLGE